VQPEQNRRADDPRINDIQQSVHEIRTDVRGLERRLERNDGRVSDVERQVIENSAAQRALESIMNSEHRRLSDKIDLIHDSIDKLSSAWRDRTSQDTQDRKSLLKILFTMLTTVIGAVAWFMFSKHAS